MDLDPARDRGLRIVEAECFVEDLCVLDDAPAAQGIDHRTAEALVGRLALLLDQVADRVAHVRVLRIDQDSAVQVEVALGARRIHVVHEGGQQVHAQAPRVTRTRETLEHAVDVGHAPVPHGDGGDWPDNWDRGQSVDARRFDFLYRIFSSYSSIIRE